jgi:nucleotide-binding universal stress UspA family protein
MAMLATEVSLPASPPATGRHIRRVLVGFDGSPGAWAALERAIAIAVSEHALLTVAGVVREPTLWLGLGGTPVPFTYETLRRDAEREMERLLATARDEVPASVSVTTQILHGRPARVLGKLAERGGYDLVVVGPRPAGRLRRWLRTGVTDRLRARFGATVLAVRTSRSDVAERPTIS